MQNEMKKGSNSTTGSIDPISWDSDVCTSLK